MKRIVGIALIVGVLFAGLVPRGAGSQSANWYYFPDVVAARTQSASQVVADNADATRRGMLFTAFQFADAGKASGNMADIAATERRHLADAYNEDHVSEISAGEIGDERIAYLAVGDFLDPATDVIIRLDRVVFVVVSRGGEGDPSAYAIDFLGRYLGHRDGSSADEMMPSLSDLPVGWSLNDSRLDITTSVNTILPTPTLTPSPTPTVTPLPTRTPYPTTTPGPTSTPFVPSWAKTPTVVPSPTPEDQIVLPANGTYPPGNSGPIAPADGSTAVPTTGS